jgi:hypothetical protein
MHVVWVYDELRLKPMSQYFGDYTTKNSQGLVR